MTDPTRMLALPQVTLHLEALGVLPVTQYDDDNPVWRGRNFQRVRTWRNRGQMPDPDLMVHGKPLWAKSTITKAVKAGTIGTTKAA